MMNERMDEKVRQLKGRLIVSCQALPEEPLHSSFIMGRMALAAKEGGAGGIRANSVEDIAQIRRVVDLPIIGIIKREIAGCSVYITPTMGEVDRLMEVKPEIIAMDATEDVRPGGATIDGFYREVRRKYPGQLLMADCSTEAEALHADALGFDFIGTTLTGYTRQSRGVRIEEDDFALLRRILAKAAHPVIAEGNINTPKKARRVIELGAFSVVVGSMITRPQVITRAFVNAMEEEKEVSVL